MFTISQDKVLIYLGGKFITAFSAIYESGHPQVRGRKIRCIIILDNEELVVKGFKILGGALFTLKYEKIDSISEDICEKWSIPRFTIGYVFFEKIGALLMGKKKQRGLTIVVNGSDKDGNIVKIPIVFSQMNRSYKAKFLIEQKINQAKGIKI